MPNQNPILPPAIVKSVVGELISAARSIYANLRINERNALERAIELGQMIEKIKKESAAGEYLANVEKIGCSQQRASEYRRIAALDDSVLAKCSTLVDAKSLLKPETESPVTPPSGDTGQNESYSDSGDEPTSDTNGFDSSSPPPPATTSPPAETVFCRDCRINGPKKKCKECASLRGKDDPPSRPKGDPVADAQAKDKALDKPGEARYVWKDFTPVYGQARRQIDLIYRSYGLLNKRGEIARDDKYEAAMDHLKKYHDTCREIIKDLSKQPVPEQ